MASQNPPFNISHHLSQLKHEKKNHSMPRLPSNTTIRKRPILHPPIASPHSGSKVQKVVYVSRKTPLMSAVMRVKRLLLAIEKRASQDVKLIERGEREGMRSLAEAKEHLVKGGESVLVKASGRAMEQALKVGEWFRVKETEMVCEVEVRAGSVSVVDDIVDVEDEEREDEDEEDDDEGVAVEQQQDESTILEGGDTTLELLGGSAKSAADPTINVDEEKKKTDPPEVTPSTQNGKGKRRRKRKKRPVYEADDVPEQRLRWIKTVEVAISFKA